MASGSKPINRADRFSEVFQKDTEHVTDKNLLVTTKPMGTIIGGMYTSGTTTYSDGAFVAQKYDSSGDAHTNTKITDVQYVSGNGGIDSATNVLETIEYEHHEIHSGSHFFLKGAVTGLSVSDTITFTVTTPDFTKWAHMVYDFVFTAGGTLQVYEGSAGISGGTPVVPINNDRNSLTTSILTILSEPTVTTSGTMIEYYIAGANRSAGIGGRDSEIILKQNENYYFVFTATANTNTFDYTAEWYEHTNKN